MLKRLLFALSIVAVLTSCDQREKVELTQRVDSLQHELAISQEAAQTLMEVGNLLDSVDASRQLLRTHMVEGTGYDEYMARMHDLNNYVKETQDKIHVLENSVRSSRSASSSYAATIKKLKADLEKTTREVMALQELVNNYRNQNDNLVEVVRLKEAEIVGKADSMRLQEEELTLVEAQARELIVQAKVNEAEAYFAQAQAMEETAKRTKFAPRKKKETRKEAIELYKMALFLGKEEAESKIAALEKKL